MGQLLTNVNLITVSIWVEYIQIFTRIAVSEHAGKGLWSLFFFICYFQEVEEDVVVDRNEVNISNYF